MWGLFACEGWGVEGRGEWDGDIERENSGSGRKLEVGIVEKWNGMDHYQVEIKRNGSGFSNSID